MSPEQPVHAAVRPTLGQDATARQRVRAQSGGARDALAHAASRASCPVREFTKGPDDAPLPTDGWYWSVSHDATLVAGAVHRSPVGIDLQRVAERRAALRQAVVSMAERELVGELDALAFTRLWTAKEAILKAAGVGLAELSRCRLVEPPGEDWMVLGHRERRCLVRQVIVAEHVVAVHTAGQGWSVAWDLGAGSVPR